VLAVGRQPLSVHGRFLAGVFSAGEGAVLSHLSAAVLWNLLPERGPRIDITVSGSAREAGRLVIVHRSALPETEVTIRNRIPVTTPARTCSTWLPSSPAASSSGRWTKPPTCAWTWAAYGRRGVAAAAPC
jgi:hypothetical protein